MSSTQVPDDLPVVRLRHYGRWVSGVLVGLLAAGMLWSLLTNPNLELSTVWSYLFKDFVLRGVGVTIVLTVVSMVIGVVVGVVIAIMRLSSNPVLRTVSGLYVWLFRGTPLLVQIIFWGFLGALYPTLSLGIPFTQIEFVTVATSALIGPTVAAILALSLNEAAYAAEIVRAGILAVDGGQSEAAAALGMTGPMTMRRIVLPQAMRMIVPPMGNETITMLKSTALVSVIGGQDLLTAIQSVYAQNFKVIPLLVVAALWYLALTTLLTVGQSALERRFGRGHDRGSRPSALARWLRGTRTSAVAGPELVEAAR